MDDSPSPRSGPALSEVWRMADHARQLQEQAHSADRELRRLLLRLHRAGVPQKLLVAAAQPHFPAAVVKNILRGGDLLDMLGCHLEGGLHLDEYPLLERGYWRLRALDSGRVEVRLLEVDPNYPDTYLDLRERLSLAIRFVRPARSRMTVEWTPDATEEVVRLLSEGEPVYARITRPKTLRANS